MQEEVGERRVEDGGLYAECREGDAGHEGKSRVAPEYGWGSFAHGGDSKHASLRESDDLVCGSAVGPQALKLRTASHYR